MLVAAREEAGVTQTALATSIKWQQTDISKVERGERRLDVAEFLIFAEALKIDPSDFIRQLAKAKKR
jgi:transcriptional regulator with XRE-family HTH domain